MKYLLILNFAFALVFLGNPILASEFNHAQKLTISPISGGYEVTIREPWANAKEVYKTTLLKKETPSKPYHQGQVVRIPVQKVVAHSTTTIGLMAALGVEDRIIAVSDGKRVNTAKVVDAIKSGKVREVGMHGKLNPEILVELQPDLILTYGTGNPKYDTAASLKRLKLPYMVLASYMENTALARCEWIKLFGILFGKESVAEQHFTMVEENYERLKRLASDLSPKPRVFCNLPFGGIWYMPSGSGWNAKLLADAGAHYLWAEDKRSGSHHLQPEQVFTRALNADIWVNPSHNPLYNIQSLLDLDSRYKNFKAIKDKKVLVATRRLNNTGGNDIFELGIARPDFMLKDYIIHFHPKALKGESPTFYRWMPE
jgi:iron complex transport system substrate-binding protein